jgi:PIN domain-containing protein
MTVRLPKELESSIEAAVHSGHFASVDDAMAEAARLLLRHLKQPSPPAHGAVAASPDPVLGSIGALKEDADISSMRSLPMPTGGERSPGGKSTVEEVLPFDRATAELAGRIAGELERTGQPIGLADPMIAAIALTHGLELVTGNTAHFQRVQNLGYPLTLVNWRLADQRQ